MVRRTRRWDQFRILQAARTHVTNRTIFHAIKDSFLVLHAARVWSITEESGQGAACVQVHVRCSRVSKIKYRIKGDKKTMNTSPHDIFRHKKLADYSGYTVFCSWERYADNNLASICGDEGDEFTCFHSHNFGPWVEKQLPKTRGGRHRAVKFS